MNGEGKSVDGIQRILKIRDAMNGGEKKIGRNTNYFKKKIGYCFYPK